MSIRTRRSLTVIAAASAVPLAFMANSAAATELYADSFADALVEQFSFVGTLQDSIANTGENEALNFALADNLTDQGAGADTHNSGYVGSNSVGNSNDVIGGEAFNDATADNAVEGVAAIEAGDALAENIAGVDVSQDNSGGADSVADATGGGVVVAASSGAVLTVIQESGVDTLQFAAANSGANFAANDTVGANATFQSGSANVSNDGGVGSGSDDSVNSAGGGVAENTSASSNAVVGEAVVTTGSATAVNESETSVSQTNSGGATSAAGTSGN
ncbi:MAG: hypothetical protein H0U89_04215 [Acidimicrobiia bacterium]|nr:hypothetical protein [Acidimicrobiia bacterium]